MLITYTQNLSDEIGVFPSSGSNPVMMTCQEIMSQAPSGYNGFIVSHSPYGNGYAGFIVFINITGDTIYLADLEYLLGRTDNSKNCAGIGETVNVSINTTMYRVQSQYTHTLQSVSSISTYTQTKDGIEYRWESFDSSWTTGDIVYFPSSVTNIYENGQPLVSYQWSSVPAISGKNGILSLTQILNINDGEPVENVTNRGNLDFSKKTKVNTLVNSVYEPIYKEDAAKATVEYEIPEAEYQYTKLVYKKKKIPKSASDGTAIDIGADDTEVVVSGLEENSTYYFVVFTNRTKSNAYKFKTGKNEAPEGIFKIRITTSQGVKDNDFKEVIEVTRV